MACLIQSEANPGRDTFDKGVIPKPRAFTSARDLAWVFTFNILPVSPVASGFYRRASHSMHRNYNEFCILHTLI
jgi:hypothetical protein